jgi:hypothetical protein
MRRILGPLALIVVATSGGNVSGNQVAFGLPDSELNGRTNRRGVWWLSAADR